MLLATIYVTILRNRMTSNTRSIVVPAIINAGLPADSVEAFLPIFVSSSTDSIQAFPGITPAIIAAATNGFRQAYGASFQTVFLASIAFGSVAILAAFLYKEISEETMKRGVVISLETTAHRDRMIVDEKLLVQDLEMQTSVD